MRDNTSAVVAMVVLALWLAFYVPACAIPQWNECRRIHPTWYCAMQEFR